VPTEGALVGTGVEGTVVPGGGGAVGAGAGVAQLPISGATSSKRVSRAMTAGVFATGCQSRPVCRMTRMLKVTRLLMANSLVLPSDDRL